jgi:hypothetical protein
VLLLYIIYLSSSLIGVVCFSKLTTPFKWVAVLLWLTLINETASWMIYKYGHPNTALHHVYSILCVPVYYQIYRPLLNKRRVWQWLQILFGILIVFCFVNTLFIQTVNLVPSYNANATSLVVITCSLLVFLNMLDEPVATPLAYQSKFWMNTAVFFYHAASFFVWSMTNYVYENNMGTPLLYKINIGLCWMLYLALGVSIWLNKKETRHE